MKRALEKIRAVSFDAGATLIEVRGSVGQVYARVAAEHGFPGVSRVALTRRFRAAWRARADFNHARAEWAVIVDATFRGLTTVPPSHTFFGQLYRRFADPDVWRVYSDVLPTLRALAAGGLKLAVISNWDQRLRPLLRRFGLLRHFDAVVVSCETGFAKPAPAIFELAALQLGLCTGEILHVGDDLECDVRGAREAGFRAIQIVRHGRRHRGAAQITSLHGLQKLL